MGKEIAYYDRPPLWGNEPLDYQREVLADILSLIPADVGSILDAGCGDGLITNALPDEMEVVALDFAACALAHVRRRKVLASAAAMPFVDESFDLVMANDVLEHLPGGDFERVLAEMLRVSRRYVLVTVPFLENLAAQTTRCGVCGMLYHINHHYRAFGLRRLLDLFSPHAEAEIVLFTGSHSLPDERVARGLRASLGLLSSWELAVCPRCGSQASSGNASSDDEYIAAAAARRVGDAAAFANMPERNEASVLFRKGAPTADERDCVEALRLVGDFDGGLSEIASSPTNADTCVTAYASKAAEASRIYMEVSGAHAALRTCVTDCQATGVYARPRWLDYDLIIEAEPEAAPARNKNLLVITSLRKLLDANAVLHADLAAEKSRAVESSRRLVETSEGLNRAEGRLRAALRETSSLTARQAESRRKVLSLTGDLQEARDLLEEARSRGIVLSRRLDSVVERIKRMRRHNASLSQSLAERDENIEALRAEVAAAAERQRVLEHDLELALAPLHHKARRALAAKVKRLGKGQWRSREEIRSLLLKCADPSIRYDAWDDEPAGRRFVMVCHDQHIDRRIAQQAQALIGRGYKGIIVALSFDGSDALDFEGDVPVHRIGLSRIVPDCPVYWRYQNRQRWIAWWGRMYHAASRFNWAAYKAELRLVYRSSRVNHPLPFDNVFHAAGRLYPAEIVVAHDLPALAAARRLSKEWDAPLVYDSHELYSEQATFSRQQKRILNEREDECIRDCDVVITVSDSIAEHIAARTGAVRPSVILNAAPRRSAMDSSRLFHRLLDLPGDAVVMLFQGGMMPNRNIETLVRGFMRAAQTNLHLVFLGPRDEAVEKRVRQCASGQIGSRVHILDTVDQDVLLNYTASADFGVIPYKACDLNTKYCMPNKMFEYIQAGLPILANDLVEVRRVLARAGGGGLVADLSNSRSMARAIRAMLARDLEADRRALEAAKEDLSWEKQAQHYVNLVENAISRHAADGN